jgi:YidC/Oxa1 family membrane protein insertase
MFALFGAVVGAAYHVLTAAMQILAPLFGGLSAAAAIVAVTIAVRLLLLPLTYYALRGQASQARLLPEITELRKRHRRDPDRLRAELAALYQRENTSALAGCLPVLLQWPVFSVLYRLFLDHSIGGRPNALLGHRLLAAPLGSHWLTGPGPLSGQGAVFAGLIALIAVVSWTSTRLTRRLPTPAPVSRPANDVRSPAPPSRPTKGQPGEARPAGGRPAGGRPAGGKAVPDQPAVPTWLTRALPYATVVIAAFVPLAAGLYLLTTTAWTAAERFVIQRKLLSAGQPGAGQPGAGRPEVQPAQPAQPVQPVQPVRSGSPTRGRSGRPGPTRAKPGHLT